MKRLLHHPLDLAPTAIITGGVLLACIPFAMHLPLAVLVALWLVSLVLRSLAPVHQHVHAHKPLFRVRAFNHAYDFVLMLAAGNTTAVWELQHVIAHHRSFLTPENDPAAVARFGEDGPWQRIVFTIAGDFLSIADSFRVALEPGQPRRRLVRLFTHLALQFGALACFFALDPWLAFFFILLPEALLRWTIFWVSWGQHHGVPNHDVYSGAVTSFGWENALFLNVGHHTAHHEKPTLHWSMLPARTELIRERMPASCLREARVGAATEVRGGP